MTENFDEQILNPNNPDSNEISLRPRDFNQYIGQDQIKDELTVYVKAAKQRNESLDHVLLYGPPGLGKTTLAIAIANEMQVNIKTVTGPSIEKTGDLVALLNDLESGDVLFIDEIHRLPKVVEEVLYSAMEDFFVDIVIGKDETTQSVHFNLPPFTLIGATTRAGMLSAPLRDRFGITAHMEYYSIDDLVKIAKRTAKVLEVSIQEDGALELAMRSRGTPRIINRLLKRVRDFAQVEGSNLLDKQIVDASLNKLNVDSRGLDSVDVLYLRSIIERYHGGPVGLNAIASLVGEDAETVEEMVEPYLIQIKFIQRTSQGRIVTKDAYQHLNIDFQGELL